MGLLVVAAGLGSADDLGKVTLGGGAARGVTDVEASGVTTGHLAAEASHNGAAGAGGRHAHISTADGSHGTAGHHAQGTLEGGPAAGEACSSDSNRSKQRQAARHRCC